MKSYGLAVWSLLMAWAVVLSADSLQLGHDDARLESEPDVVVDSLGNVTVVWSSRVHEGAQPLNGVRIRRFDGDGGVVGKELRIDLLPGDLARTPSVDVTPDGERMVVVWEGGAEGRRTKRRIWAQIFDGSGQPVGSEIRVDQLRMTHDGRGVPREWYGGPRVSVAPSGDFVVAWRSEGRTTCDRFNISARRFSSEGEALDDQFVVNRDRRWSQVNPDVDHDASGRFLIVWEDGRWIGTDQERSVVRGRFFDEQGNEIGKEFILSSSWEGSAVAPTLDVSADGFFVCAWTDAARREAPARIHARAFSVEGAPLGGSVVIERASAEAGRPTVALTGEDSFGVVWEDDWNDRFASRSIFGQGFSIAGVPSGEPLPLSTRTCSPASRPAVAISPHGVGVLAWQNTGRGRIHLRRFHTADPLITLPILGVGPLLSDFVSGWRKDILDHRLDSDERQAAAERLACTRGEGSAALADLTVCLSSGDDPGVRAACAGAVAAVTETPGAVIRPLVVSLRQDDDPQVRAAAARAIGSLGSEARSAVRALIAALDDESVNVRASVGLALGLIGDASAVDVMVGELDGPLMHQRDFVRGLALLVDNRKAYDALRRFTGECVEETRQEKRERDRVTRDRSELERFVQEVMESAGVTDEVQIDRTARYAYRRLMRDRIGVFGSTEEHEDGEFFDAVDRILESYLAYRERDAGGDVCGCLAICASGLAEIDPFTDWAASEYSNLLPTAESASCVSRLLAVAVKMGPRGAKLAGAIGGLASTREDVRLEAVRALEATDPSGDKSVAMLHRLLGDADPEVRAAVIRALVTAGVDAIRGGSGKLTALLGDPSPSVGQLAEMALDLAEIDAEVCGQD